MQKLKKMSTKEVEKKAIDLVIAYEKKRGQKEVYPVNRNKDHIGYDVKSDNLKIEVKARGPEDGSHLLFSKKNIECLEGTDSEDYSLYAVVGVRTNNPKLKILSKEKIKGIKQSEESWVIPTTAKNGFKTEQINLNQL